MDYLTKPVSRELLRKIADIIRESFHVSQYEKFPVLRALEKVCTSRHNISYEILPDEEMPKNVPARCLLQDDGGFLIQIAETVYNGAYEREVGGYRSHILHEICHVLLYKMGFTPIVERSFENNEVTPYCSVEWQAKALCGELMMPYEATKGLTEKEIVSEYGVSYEAARQRKRYDQL